MTTSPAGFCRIRAERIPWSAKSSSSWLHNNCTDPLNTVCTVVLQAAEKVLGQQFIENWLTSPTRTHSTNDSGLLTDQRECKCRKRAVRRESFTWSSVGSKSRGHLHRDNKVAGEKIGEQVSERRRVA